MNDTNGQMNYNIGESKKTGFRLAFLIGAVAVLCIAIIVGVVVLVNGNGNQQKYIAAVNMGNDYYNAGDYYNAILQYQQAIKLNDKEPSSYLNMSSAYMVLGDMESAQAIIIQGLKRIESEALRQRLAELENGKNSTVAQNISADEIQRLATGVTLENTSFDMAAAYTYTEYYRDFGKPASNIINNGQVSLHYNTLTFDAVYYDLANERVLDNSGNMPLASVKPCYISFQSVRSLFSSSEETFAVSFDKLKELLGDDTALSFDETQNRYVVTAEHKGCKLMVETDENGNIVSEFAWNRLEPLARQGLELEAEADGQVTGYIQDATNGRGMVANIKVRERGSRTGQVLDEFSSGKDGSYSFGAAQGTYTLEISANGYVTEYMDAEIIRGQIKTGKNIVLSPTVAAGEIRIVLTWGSSPSDLDSHAQGRSSTGSNFHISYQNKNIMNVGNLDIDDTNGHGPETITITDSGASFTYSVIDFTNSSSMSNSNAMVKVYLPGNAQAIVYNVPSGGGNEWTVFTFENGQITPINTIR